jgi:hypothetical protein
MQLEYFEDLSVEDQDLLWKQDVSMDDWDYLLICYDLDQFQEASREESYWWDESEQDYVPTVITIWEPKSWTLTRLLTGCYHNPWKKIIWRGKEAFIGVAYHG